MKEPLSVNWHAKKPADQENRRPIKWCDFFLLNLTDANVRQPGVYIIWRPNTPLPVVYVGQGQNCANRLKEHRQNQEITDHMDEKGLFVTWAKVDGGEETRERVERFLADRLKPLVGIHSQVAPLAVNLPPLEQYKGSP